MKIWQTLISWITGGIIYFYMEIAFRGYSHYTMLMCGGVCFVLVGKLGRKIFQTNRFLPITILMVMLVGTLIITTTELFTGMLVNVKLHMDIWSYEDMPFNYKGQICVAFSILWAFLSLLCVLIENGLQKYIYR